MQADKLKGVVQK